MIPFYLKHKESGLKYMVLKITAGGIEPDLYHIADLLDGEIQVLPVDVIIEDYIYAGFKALPILNAMNV